VEYGCVFVLVALFLKGVIFLGPFMPGAVVLLAVGWFARQGQGSPYLLALCAFLGTVLGDIVSYEIGRKSAGRLLRSKRWGKAIALVSDRVRNEPALLIFCHFETFLRMFVPATAGVSGVPFRRWLMLNATGTALWVAAYIAAGYFLSRAGALAAGNTIGLSVIGLLILLIAAHYVRGRLKHQRERRTREHPESPGDGRAASRGCRGTTRTGRGTGIP
jgi:membrane protein DedA with SNARE-associated domain